MMVKTTPLKCINENHNNVGSSLKFFCKTLVCWTIKRDRFFPKLFSLGRPPSTIMAEEIELSPTENRKYFLLDLEMDLGGI